MKHWLFALGILGLAGGAAQAQQGGASPGLVRQLNDAFAGVYEKVAPSVVVLKVERSAESAVPGLPEGLDFFFRSQDGSALPLPPQEGSGIIISKDGYILTNNHVVAGAVRGGIKVELKDGRRFLGSLIGSDPRGDIAVVKIEARDLPVAELGDSDHVKVGNFAFAVGAPEALPYTFTVGTVSAIGRQNLTSGAYYEEFIQTDAFIHPGSSGGPLCDIDGKVIGLNTLINGINRGLGFAIPINIARNLGAQLIASGRVSRPYLGVKIDEIEIGGGTDDPSSGLRRGVVVRGIQEGAPAYPVLRVGDVITKVDGVGVVRTSDLQKQILGKRVGQTVRLDVWREGRAMEVAVTTGELPDQFIPAANPAGAPPRQRQPAPMRGQDLFGLTITEMEKKVTPSGETPARGVMIAEVEPRSAAEVAGIEPGDIIKEAGGKPVRTAADLKEVLSGMDAGRGVLLLIDRGGEEDYAILKP